MTVNEMRMQHEVEMNKELSRVKALLATRNIHEIESSNGNRDRLIKIETPYDYCRIKWTFFRVPQGIDIEKVVWWFVHKTKYGKCTVYMSGKPYTTIWNDAEIKRFFKKG